MNLFLSQISGSLILQGIFGSGILQMVAEASAMVKFVLWILALFSIISWAIIFTKFRLLRRAKNETEIFLDYFWRVGESKRINEFARDLEYSPVAHLFRSGYGEFNRIRKLQTSSETKGGSRPWTGIMDNLERALSKTTIDQIERMERAVSFLATTGNTTPFIGLFGTVWGIMESFRGIGLKGSANLAVVAPGISEALVATAAGLAAAIPAVIAFNYFTHKIASLRSEMDIFTSDFLSMAERKAFK
jgi:biopolymer transport protein TolQ